MTEIFAIANQKGGVGKTTTAVNLASALAFLGQETLLVDMDPQGNATSALGISKRSIKTTVYPVLVEETLIESAIFKSPMEWLDVLPSNSDLTGAEIELVGAMARETRLKTALGQVRGMYRFVIIDCPPSLGLLTLNALTAATKLLVPIQCEYFAMEGLAQLMDTFRRVRQALNPSPEFEGGVLTMFDSRVLLGTQVRGEIEKYFGDKLFKTFVPRNVRLAEAPSFGQPIFIYDPKSRGSEAYMDLAIELLSRRSGAHLAPVAEFKSRFFVKDLH